jgi:predicted transcriptional regulator
MGPREKKMITILTKMGWKEIKAKCAVYFVEHDYACSGDIERAMNLRQPEVSMGLRELMDDGVILRKMEEKKKYCGRGRRRLLFHKKISDEKYVDYIAKSGTKKMNAIEEQITRLREIKEVMIKRAKKQNIK